MTVRVFIDGAAGTTGLEIRDRLAGRRDIRLTVLAEDRRRDPAARADALAAADIAILCLPDEAAREAVTLAEGTGARIIDASTAHRVAPGWSYGFPEIEPGRRAEIGVAALVANPGCYPTGFLALVRPLTRAGLLPAAIPLGVSATSGYSGGGKAMIAEFEGGAPATAFRAYALGLGHKHLAEMRVHGGLAHAPIFMPAVARTYRGMVVEVPLHLSQLAPGATAATVREALADSYAGQPLVRVVQTSPAVLEIEAAAGSDRIDLHVFADEGAGQLRLIALLDNLGKGAAGAAVQSLNLMAGLPELAGLRP